MMILFILIFLSIFPISAQAEEFSIENLEVSLGLEGISLIQRRGATFYDSYQVFPLLAIKLFHPNFQIVGSSLYYNYQLNNSIRIFSILNPQISNQPLYETNIEATNEEKSASEWDHILEYKTDQQLISLLVSQGFKGHFGSHFELRYRYTFLQFMLKKIAVQASGEFKLGWGSTLHNQFYYGKNITNSGLSYHSLGMVLTGEPKVDRLFPLLEIQYNHIIGGNRKGDFIKNKPQNFYFLFILAKNLI